MCGSLSLSLGQGTLWRGSSPCQCCWRSASPWPSFVRASAKGLVQDMLLRNLQPPRTQACGAGEDAPARARVGQAVSARAAGVSCEGSSGGQARAQRLSAGGCGFGQHSQHARGCAHASRRPLCRPDSRGGKWCPGSCFQAVLLKLQMGLCLQEWGLRFPLPSASRRSERSGFWSCRC